jgi:hypothetical protein
MESNQEKTDAESGKSVPVRTLSIGVVDDSDHQCHDPHDCSNYEQPVHLTALRTCGIELSVFFHYFRQFEIDDEL